MSANGSAYFVLTRKGSEELSTRTHRLDIKLRNILFLIQKGTPTIEAILQNSIFPREEVVEKLRALLKEQFVALNAGSSPVDRIAAPGNRPATIDIPLTAEAVGGAAAGRSSSSPFLSLLPHASPSQARFVLCDFCLDQFGMRAQPMVDAINAAPSIAELQQVLDDISVQMQKHFEDQLPALAVRVREINEADV